MGDHEAVERDERSQGSREKLWITRHYKEMIDHKAVERERDERSQGSRQREERSQGSRERQEITRR